MTNYTENLSYNSVNVTEPPTYADLANTTGNLETQTLATEIGRAIGPQTVGTRPLTGIALLAVLGFGLYQNQTSLDTDKVKKRLQSRKYRTTGYKTRRYKADISFIEKEMNKRNDFELGLDLGLGL